MREFYCFLSLNETKPSSLGMSYNKSMCMKMFPHLNLIQDCPYFLSFPLLQKNGRLSPKSGDNMNGFVREDLNTANMN